MARFRKKPVEIEAFRWTGGRSQEEDPDWICEAIDAGNVWFSDPGTEHVTLKVLTLEGVMTAKQGDYIIKGIAGELYPCAPEIFVKTYDLVPEGTIAYAQQEIPEESSQSLSRKDREGNEVKNLEGITKDCTEILKLLKSLTEEVCAYAIEGSWGYHDRVCIQCAYEKLVSWLSDNDLKFNTIYHGHSAYRGEHFILFGVREGDWD